MSEQQAMIDRAVEAISPRLDGRRPVIGLILGSGSGHLADRARDAVAIPYADIPGFPVPTVPGHAGRLIAGTIAGSEVLMQSGRFHMYEGYDAAHSALPVRVMAELGIRILVVTNAAGGIRPSFGPGTLMLITDHLNLTGRTPLLGEVLPGEIRFPDMSQAYDLELRRIAQRVAVQEKIALEEGIYAGLLGPSFETPAEIRMLTALGADAVGMSTVAEVIAARARGIRCLGFSTITNSAAGLGQEELSHDDVMRTAGMVQDRMALLIEGCVAGAAQGTGTE